MVGHLSIAEKKKAGSDDHLLSALRICGIFVFHSPALAHARLRTFVEISWVIYSVSSVFQLSPQLCVYPSSVLKTRTLRLNLVIFLKSQRLSVIDLLSGVLIPQ